MPALDAEHRQQHQDLRAKVRAMHQRSASGEKTMTIEVAQFVVQYTASDIPRSCCIWILAKPTFTRFTYARM
jgi:hemerythrin